MVSLARIIAVLLAVLVMSNIASSVPNTNIRSVLCNSGIFTKGDPFTISLAYVLDDLENFTTSQKGYDYYNISPYPNAFSYGHARCNSTLITADCTTCLRASKQALFSSCPSRIGARSVLYDCSMRYEQYPFAE
ncbi:Antifungal protein ginkbilobin-like protein [Thalictrum thalictroides]|uniref:Antifungal protein ginkbilobin-like protein n=1 Tax=Thalictrum thalictroides TaxID=46969 RepID=A0A7J6WEL3_THATH|nr:Antifungal protein ginkbilobin-like protein [Thalictrum thalictroides]